MLIKGYKKIKNKLSSKKGASNLEAIILMTVAIVVGGALMNLGGNIKRVVERGSVKVNEIGNNL